MRRCVRLTHFAKRKSFLANRKCHPRHQYLWRRRQWPGSIGGHGSARGHGPCRPAFPKLFLPTVILGFMHFGLGPACDGIADIRDSGLKSGHGLPGNWVFGVSVVKRHGPGQTWQTSHYN